MALRVIGAVGFIQLVLTILAGGFFFAEHPKLVSLLFGSGLSFLNFVLLVYLWKLIFRSNKKRVALAIFLIVIKYAILIWVFTQIPKEKSLEAFVFAIGVIINPAAVIGAGFSYKFFRKAYFENKK